MNKKIYVFILALFFLVSVTVYAQEWPTSQDIMSKVQAEMDLDANQLTKVKEIVELNIAERQEVKPQSTQGMTQAESQQFESKLYSQLRDVMTRSQLNQWNGILSRLLQEMDAK